VVWDGASSILFCTGPEGGVICTTRRNY
jgi:hypothetical protein